MLPSAQMVAIDYLQSGWQRPILCASSRRPDRPGTSSTHQQANCKGCQQFLHMEGCPK